MQTASSANFTCNEFASAVECIATVFMLSSLQALIILKAISPRFAINILLNIIGRRFSLIYADKSFLFKILIICVYQRPNNLHLLYYKHWLAKFNRMGIFYQYRYNPAAHF